jgi:hypothetical protein
MQEKLRAELLQKQMLQLNQMKLHFSKKNADRGTSSSPSSPSINAVQKLPSHQGRPDPLVYPAHSPLVALREHSSLPESAHNSSLLQSNYVNISPSYPPHSGFRPFSSANAKALSPSHLLMKRKEPSFLGICCLF